METLPDDTILHVLRHCAALNRIHCVRLVSMRYKELVARLGIGSLVFDDNTGPRWSTEEYEFAGQMTVGSGHNQGGNYTSGVLSAWWRAGTLRLCSTRLADDE